MNFKKFSSIALATSILFTGVSAVHTESNVEAATKPYYKYNGYTTSEAKFVLDKYFVLALKYHTFSLNGYTVHKNSNSLGQDGYFEYKGATIRKDINGKTDSIHFKVKPGVVKKAAFLKAHKANLAPIKGNKGLNHEGYEFNTESGRYFAIFDKKGYLKLIEINSTPPSFE